MNCMHFIFICHLLMLAYLCVENVVIIINWCLYYFLWLKHINELHLLHLHLSFTDVDIFLCRKYSRISILLLIIYWYWPFFMCKMFLTFSIDVYVIFFDWNISMICTHFTILGHLLMLIYFCVLFQTFIWKISLNISLSSGYKVSLKSFFKLWSQSFIKKFP